MLHIIEDNETLIEMMIQGRSPTTCIQNPKSCFRLVFLTELIWTPRFRSGTLTPHTNLQTFEPKVISRVMSGIIFFVSSMLVSALFAASKVSVRLVALRCQKEFRNKKKKKGLCPRSRPPVMNISFCLTSSTSASSPIASKNPGTSELRGWYQNEYCSKFFRLSFSVSSEIEGCTS